MALWKGKTRGGVLGYKLFVLILNNFGLSFAYFVLRIVVFYYYLSSPRSSKNIFYLYNKLLKLSIFTSLIKIYQNYFLLGQVLLDKVAVLSGIRTSFTFEFDGEENLRELVEGKTGGILIGAHVGNWEIAGYLLKRLNGRFNLVMLDAEHQKIKKYLSTVLSDKEVNIIVVRNDLSHVFEINRVLKKGEMVCVHGDRYIDEKKTMSCEFLGKEALFPTGPFLLANKFDVPVSYVFAMKESKTHYHFYASPHRKTATDMKKMISDYAEELEKIVWRYPEQWFNYYDFWGEQ